MSNNQIQIFIRVGASNNTRGTLCYGSHPAFGWPSVLHSQLSALLNSTDLNIQLYVFVLLLHARVLYYLCFISKFTVSSESNIEIIVSCLVLKASYDGYFSCRDPKDLLERLDLMESKDLKYFSFNIHSYLSINYYKNTSPQNDHLYINC